MCLTRDLPLTIQSCVLPTDCKLTDWTIWSPCTKTCMNPESPRGNRTRTRQVLQFPVGEGAECPPLEQFESCEPQGESIPPCATWVTPDDREEMQGAQVGVSRDLKKHWVKCRCGIHSMVHNRSSCFTGIELHVMLWLYPPLIYSMVKKDCRDSYKAQAQIQQTQSVWYSTWLRQHMLPAEFPLHTPPS